MLKTEIIKVIFSVYCFDGNLDAGRQIHSDGRI